MKANSDGFIVSIIQDWSFVPHELAVFGIHYDKIFYRDSLFETYGVLFADSMINCLPQRRAQYFAGRLCTTRALISLGAKDTQVATSAERAPIWPQGVVGSISHSNDYAIAMTGEAKLFNYIGVDIEIRQEKIFNELASEFTSPGEQSYLSSLMMDYDLALLITFSAKESLFKALWPQLRFFFGFASARIIKIDDRDLTFTLQLTCTLSQSICSGMLFEGQYYLMDNNLLTFIVKYRETI